MTKNILQVVQHLKPGGIETMALDLQHHLINCHVHIVSLEGTKNKSLHQWSRLKSRSTHLHFLNKKPGIRLSTLTKLCLLIKKLKIDAVHTHHIGPLTYGGMAARLCSVKHLIHTEHDVWHLESNKAAKLETKLINFLKPSLVADCKMVAKKLGKLSSKVEPNVIYNGIDTELFRPVSDHQKIIARFNLGLPMEFKMIGTAARLEKVKGISFLIEAVSKLPDDVHLCIAGTGSYMDRLKRHAHMKGCEDRIIFLGRIDNMAEFYSAIDLFCLPSLNEGFPLSPLEAQACNVPAVLTDVGGASEALCPQTGVLIPPGDVNALTTALEEKIQQLSNMSPSQFVRERADVRQMCRAYSKLLAI